jgi:hypothetical protein
MFGLSKKERVGEALRRGTAAVLTGAFFHPAEIEALGLNNEAASWIYTESLAHQIFALGLIYSNSSFSSESWATAEFFNNTVSEAITKHERENSLRPGTINSVIFNRIDDLSLIYREGVAYQHLLDSATKATEKDPRANRDQIFEKLKSSTENYFMAASKMF